LVNSVVLPGGETLDHHYDTGGSVTRISGRNDDAPYDYLSALHKVDPMVKTVFTRV
jgi:hypothetical protein